jgi:hypothetical protein
MKAMPQKSLAFQSVIPSEASNLFVALRFRVDLGELSRAVPNAACLWQATQKLTLHHLPHCHSRESGHPVAAFWIPAFAGMTEIAVARVSGLGHIGPPI